MKNDEKDGDNAGAEFFLILLLIGAVWVSYNIYDQTKETKEMVKRIVQGRSNIPCNNEAVIRLEEYEELEEILERYHEKEAKEI